MYVNNCNEYRRFMSGTGRFSLLIRIVFALCISSALFSCAEKEAPVQEKTPVAVQTVTVTMEKLDDVLNSFGTVTYKTKHDVTALVEGTISSLSVREGDRVRKGQQIAVLRNVQMEIQKEQSENALVSARAALRLAETKLWEERLGIESRILSLDKSAVNLKQKEIEYEDAEENLESKKELHEIGGITDSAYKTARLGLLAKETEIEILRKECEISMLGLRDEDLADNGFAVAATAEEKTEQLIELNSKSVLAEIESARASVSNAEKSLDSVNRLLEELVIASPVAGIVGAKYFESGEFVPENEKVATIMDVSSVYAVFYIQELDIYAFSKGTPLTVEIPSIGKTIKTSISEISPVADAQSGNFSVKAEIDNRDSQIKPGMFVKCTISRAEAISCPVVPETALIQKKDSSASVFAVINDYAVLKKICIELVRNGRVWVAEGLADGDVVIDKPSPFLKEGEYVQVR